MNDSGSVLVLAHELLLLKLLWFSGGREIALIRGILVLLETFRLLLLTELWLPKSKEAEAVIGVNNKALFIVASSSA